MANANIDVLYACSLRIKISCFFSSNFTFCKLCVTKVAHCRDYHEVPSVLFGLLKSGVSSAKDKHKTYLFSGYYFHIENKEGGSHFRAMASSSQVCLVKIFLF